MAAPAFGFSAGDFVEAIKVISKVAKALQDSTGAPAQYTRTVVELDTLADVLRRTQQLRPDSSRNGGIVDKIHYAAHVCHIPIVNFANQIKKYDEHLSQQSGPGHVPSNQWARGARKAQWALQVERALETLKASIGPCLQAIEIYLQLEAAERAVSMDGNTRTSLAIAEQLVVASAQLSAHVSERVASHLQVEPIMPALQRLLLDQQRMLALSTQRFDRVEQLLKASAGVISQSPNGPQLRTGNGVPPLHNIANGQGKTSLVPASRSFASRTEHVRTILRTARDQCAELFVLLFCLVPALQTFLRTLNTIVRAPSMLLDDNVIFEDAHGRSMSLPYQHFRYWDVLCARLRTAYQGWPVEDHIPQKFSFFEGTEPSQNSLPGRSLPAFLPGRFWEESVWESRIRPRMRIRMQTAVWVSPQRHSDSKCRLVMSTPRAVGAEADVWTVSRLKDSTLSLQSHPERHNSHQHYIFTACPPSGLEHIEDLDKRLQDLHDNLSELSAENEKLVEASARSVKDLEDFERLLRKRIGEELYEFQSNLQERSDGRENRTEGHDAEIVRGPTAAYETSKAAYKTHQAAYEIIEVRRRLLQSQQDDLFRQHPCVLT